MINEFKAFINKGNFLDLAVAVIMAAAFGLVVTSFTNDILMQIIAAIFGQPDFNSLSFNLGNGVIKYGAFLNTIINFLIVAFVMFLVIKAYNNMKKPTAAQTDNKDCPYCLSTIPPGATRCPNCTSDLTKAA
jgi:large conductance mechanosensitive channel